MFLTWWFIPLSKWVITLVISGLTPLIPFITRVITHLLSGMNHQVPKLLFSSCGSRPWCPNGALKLVGEWMAILPGRCYDPSPSEECIEVPGRFFTVVEKHIQCIALGKYTQLMMCFSFAYSKLLLECDTFQHTKDEWVTPRTAHPDCKELLIEQYY